QATTDALIFIPQVPSGGFTSSQLSNVGEIENSGIEFSMNVAPVRGRDVSVDLGFRYSTNKSRVLDLGNLQSVAMDWNQFIRPCSSDVGGSGLPIDSGGYAECPLPGNYHWVIDPDQDPNALEDPVMIEQYLGPSYPTRTIGFDANIEVFNRLSLNALGEFQGGHSLNAGEAYQNTRRLVWPECRDVHSTQSKTRDPDPAVKAEGWAEYDLLTAYQRAKCWSGITTYGMWTNAADFFKLRSISLSYQIPETLLGGGRSATIRFQGRNLLTLTDFEGMDPEALEDGSRDWASFRQSYYNLPPAKSFMMSLSVNF
ncbi:MAG: TonB-dependent receptor, partial [Gemmatimonadota bacterium]|nr:TonB-dependent receptor [Gemmatimonadota bacterium]